MKKRIFTLFAALFTMHTLTQAQLVREYNPGASSNLIFTCISKAQNGNYFIAGLQDTSVYVSEVTLAGNVVREKLIGIGTNYYRLSGMITDGDGNIVIVGLWRDNSSILHGYTMKISPMLSLIAYNSYNNTKAGNGMAFTDIKDYKTNGANNAYYVTGYTFGSDGWNALLYKLDRNTGAIIASFHGRATAAPANSAQNSYSSLLLDSGNVASPAGIYVSAPLNYGAIANNRPWVTTHAVTNLAFTRGQRYLRDVTSAQQASLYNIGMAKDGTNLLYCWFGSPNVASNNTHTAMGITKVVAGTLAPVWQKAYTLTPANASPNKYKALTKIENDPKGYIARGCWNDGVNESGGDIFFIRTDKNGAPVWARQYKNVSNVQSFNSNFIVDGANILAVGFRTNQANKRGILIVTPLATGLMDTTCAKPLLVSTADSLYTKADDMQSLALSASIKSNYYAINCVSTVSQKPCTGCTSSPVALNSGYNINSQLLGNSTTFTVTASAFNTGNNSRFVVSQVNTTTLQDIPGTVGSIPSWGGPGTVTSFPSYVFTSGLLYRVRHIVSDFNNCGILVSDTTSKLVFLAPGLISNDKGVFQYIDEGGSAGSSALLQNGLLAALSGKGSGGAYLYPNPANASVILNTSFINDEKAVIKIVNGNGQTMLSNSLNGKKQSAIDTHLWAGGLYLYSIISNGKVVSQGRFLVQH